MPMTNLIKACAQSGQTGRNADKIPRHTSEVNYARMVLHCAAPSVSSLSVVLGRCGIVDRDWADLMGRAPPDTLNKNGKCYCL